MSNVNIPAQELKQRLKTAGYGLKNVHSVLVTHSHPDHFGGAGRIARENGAELITHHAFSTWTVQGPSPHRALTEGEAKRAEVEAAAYSQAVDVEPDEIPTINDDADVVHDDTEETEPTSSPWGAITPWGSRNPGPPLRRKWMIRAMRMLFTPPEPTERVHHGDRLRIGAGDWYAVHTPGHTVFAIHSGDQSLLVLSDTAQHPAVFARHPDWQAVFDIDGLLRVMGELVRRVLPEPEALGRDAIAGVPVPAPRQPRIEGACGFLRRERCVNCQLLSGET